MKTIVIAAGYATRLYPLTENFPKPLLNIGGSTILGRMMADIDAIPGIEEHIIVSNHKFVSHFNEWAAAAALRHPVRIVDDGTTTNETRLGAVRDLMLAIDECGVDDDILVVAADNILDFSFSGFVGYFQEKRASVIMCHREPELKRLRRTGVIEVDADMRVLSMQEKPLEPVSHWAVPPFYIYRRDDISLMRRCIADGCNADAPGNLLQHICRLTPVYAWKMPGRRFDIGSMDSYKEACLMFAAK